MKEIQIDELRELQMQILDYVDSFCRRHGIIYSIACGTLLGAVRHGGFIPWDDDIDVYMRRKDFAIFEKLFPDNSDGKYTLYSTNKYNQWHLPFGKVVDNRTIVINDYVNIIPIGVSIDVFIVDEVPDMESQWLSFREKQLSLIRLNLDHTYKIRWRLGIRKNFRTLYSMLRCFPNRKKMLNRISKYISANNDKGYSRCFETTQGIHAKNPFDKSLFEDIIDWKFEDRTYCGFQDADHYLRNTFGDYMKLPPKEKQVSHHTEKAYWKQG